MALPRWIAVVLVVAIALRAHRTLDAPAVPPGRARELLALHETLLADAPRPTGSAEAAAARARISLALAERGCPPHEQEAWSCVPGQCARVVNLWCRLGPAEGDAVVGLSHTDSAGAGPGAGDAGAGVVAWVDAVGRLAREPLARPFVLVLTDGEELGLLGARALFDDPPFPDPIGAVVNLEARGTAGASLLFETVGPPIAWGTVLARGGFRPSGSSAYAAVYDRMPNDTDLSVVRAHHLPGVNHAFLRNLPHYHTPDDTRANLDVRSMAHHADAAFGHVRALQDPPAGEQAFTDVLGLLVVRWPAGASLPAAVVLLLGWVGWLVADLRAGATSGGAIGRAAAAAAGLLVAAVALVEVAAPVAGDAWYGNPAPLRLAAIAATVACVLPLGAVADPVARWHAALGPAAVAGLSLTVADARLSVLMLPAVVVALAWRTACARARDLGVLGLGPALAGAWLPYAFGLDEALTLEHPAVVAVPLFVALAGLAPALPRAWVAPAGVLLGLAGVALGAAAIGPAPPFPRNVVVVQGPDGLTTGGVRLGLPPPEVTPVAGGIAVRPVRGGTTLRVRAEGPLALDGRPVPTEGGWVEIDGVPPEGVVLGVEGPVLVGEVTRGVADEALVAARAPAVPIHDGDRTVVYVESP